MLYRIFFGTLYFGNFVIFRIYFVKIAHINIVFLTNYIRNITKFPKYDEMFVGASKLATRARLGLVPNIEYTQVAGILVYVIHNVKDPP